MEMINDTKLIANARESQLETSRAEHLHWVEQWRSAGIALQKIKDAELATMSLREAQLATQRILSVPYKSDRQSPRWKYSGLVEQQKYFMKVLFQNE